MMYGHPSAPLLLELSQLAEDTEMLDVLDSEGYRTLDLIPLIEALEAICDVSFRDSQLTKG